MNKIFYALRVRIFEYQIYQTDCFSGEVELDESCFAARRGRGAVGKTPVFGVLHPNFTQLAIM